MTITTRAGKGSALTHAEMDANLGYLVPPGAVMAFARNSAPAGWLECSGAAVSRTSYAQLFAAIGTTFGAGDGSTTFNLPNLRGEFIRGWDNGRGVDSGRAFGSAQAGEIQSHSHGITDPGHAHRWGTDDTTGASGAGNPDASGGTDWRAYTETVTTGISINNSGGAETRPRNIAMLYCIKI